MRGIICDILCRRFGSPVAGEYAGLPAHIWKPHDAGLRCTLLLAGRHEDSIPTEHAALKELYGNTRGGFLLGSSLRVASLLRSTVWGLHPIDELQAQPPVRRARALRPKADYWMDAASTWYYGCSEGSLCCYDTADDTVADLGEVSAAMDAILTEWLDAAM